MNYRIAWKDPWGTFRRGRLVSGSSWYDIKEEWIDVYGDSELVGGKYEPMDVTAYKIKKSEIIAVYEVNYEVNRAESGKSYGTWFQHLCKYVRSII
jgi:hypothetical protein